mgnify:CR=1 FL=1
MRQTELHRRPARRVNSARRGRQMWLRWWTRLAACPLGIPITRGRMNAQEGEVRSLGFHASASRCASAIWAEVILAATRSRFLTASAR